MEGLSRRQSDIVRKIYSLGNWEAFYVLARLMLDVDTSRPFDGHGYPTNVFFHASTYEALSKAHERGDRDEHRRRYDARLAGVRKEMAEYFKMAKDEGLLEFSNFKAHYRHYTGKKPGRV